MRSAVGAYALGALDPDEAAAVRRHLEGCEECRAEHDALAPLPSLLSLAEGADTVALQSLPHALSKEGAVPSFVGTNLGTVEGIDVEITLETGPSVLFDAVVIPDWKADPALTAIGPVMEFVRDQYRHCKPILALGSGARLLEAAGIPKSLPNGDDDPGLLHAVDVDEVAADFIAAIAKHRHLERFRDPPRV